MKEKVIAYLREKESEYNQYIGGTAISTPIKGTMDGIQDSILSIKEMEILDIRKVIKLLTNYEGEKINSLYAKDTKTMYGRAYRRGIRMVIQWLEKY